MIKILYIEDEPSLQRTVKRGLERSFGAQTVAVDVAGDAPTAIKFLRAALQTFGCFHYDHIICDWDLLGGTNGGEVLAWIKDTTDANLNDWQTANDHGDIKTPREVLLERFTFLTSRSEHALAVHDRFVEKPCAVKVLALALATKGPVCITSSFGIDG